MCDIKLLSTLYYFIYLAWSAEATTINPVNAVKKDSTEKGILSKVYRNISSQQKKETPTQVSFCEFCKIFKNTFFYRTPPGNHP